MKILQNIAGGMLGMTTYELVKLLILLLFISAIGIGILTVYKNITGKLRSISSDLFGTTDFVKGLKMAADIQAETPKSVSAMTRLMEPQIMRDFPEFSWEEFKHKAENMLTSALLAISANNADRMVEASEDIRKQVENIIEDNRANNIGETYSDIEIHQTEIANYQKLNGKCVITIQSAVGYLYYKMQDGKLIAGDKNRKTQTKYNIELVYIQDPETTTFDNAVGTTCPQCGAPIKVLGAKFCEYCGTGVTPINIKVWSLHKFYEVDYN